MGNRQATSALGADRERGFSLVELLVVVGLIAVMAAVALPGIARYMRNYQIRGAAQELAGEIQTARSRAITKNVNLGVLFVVDSPTTYRFMIEDDMTPNVAPKWSSRSGEDWDNLVSDPAQLGPARQLPSGIQFDATCASATGGAAAAPNDWSFRFNRLGAWCDPSGTAEPCPLPPGGPTPTSYVVNDGGATLCLTQPQTSLRRNVTVTVGGRVLTQP